MDVVARAQLSAQPEAVFVALADLATYPHWLSIVGTATPAGAHPADAGPAWAVELVGRFGPLARTKRVRMVRVSADGGDGRVRFERAENDGEAHHGWVLTASASPLAEGDGTAVEVHLRYTGPMLPGVDLLLRREAAKAGPRLDRFVCERLSGG